MKKIIFILVGIFLLVSPRVSFAENVPCSAAAASCTCTDADGTSSSLTDSSITDSYSCASRCNDLGAASYKLFCDESTLTPTISGDIATYLDEIAAALGIQTITKEDPTIPALNVPIPGLDLTDSVRVDTNGYVTTNMIGLYVNAVFSYAIVLAAIFGVLMLTLAGFQYMTAGGDKGAVSKAKARMQNVIFGLVILMATYSIAFLIDPRTTYFNGLTLSNVIGIEYFPPEGEDDNITFNGDLDGSSISLEGDYLIPGSSDMELDEEALSALQAAAQSFYSATGSQIYVASAKRDLEKQSELFYDNCLRRGGTCSIPTCNPANSSVITKSGSRFSMIGALAGETRANTIISTLAANASYSNCPHTSAVAVDLWCNDGGSNYQHDPACQDTLIKTMIDHGFCRLTSEAWHFEYASKKVSTNCLTSNNSVSYTNRAGSFSPSTATCRRWDFKNNKCITAK